GRQRANPRVTGCGDGRPGVAGSMDRDARASPRRRGPGAPAPAIDRPLRPRVRRSDAALRRHAAGPGNAAGRHGADCVRLAAIGAIAIAADEDIEDVSPRARTEPNQPVPLFDEPPASPADLAQ